MTIFSHILLTSFGIQMLGLDGTDMLLAVGFGIGPDLDHLIKIPLYCKKHKFKLFKFFTVKDLPKERQYHWRTPLQEPVSLLWIIPISIFIESVIPIIFFLSHVLLDYLTNYPKQPLFPFSNFKTAGFLKSVPYIIKETALIVILLCLNLLLALTKK